MDANDWRQRVFAGAEFEIGARVAVLRAGPPDAPDHARGGHRISGGPDVRRATVDNRRKKPCALQYLVDVDGAGRFWVDAPAVRPVDD